MKQRTGDQIQWIPVPRGAEVHTAALHLIESAPRADTRTPLERAIDAIGIPQAPPPSNATPLAEARYLLEKAAEIEHGLLVQYLYAAYSLDVSQAEPRNWARSIIEIAIQEMFHLYSVQNLRLSVGVRPYFDRENYPVDASPGSIYPFPFALEPVSVESVAKYVVAESPVDIADPALRAEVEAIRVRADRAATGQVNHVGLIYAKLYWIFLPSDDATGPWKNFPSDRFESCQSGWHLTLEDFASENLNDDVQPDPDADGWSPNESRGRVAHRVLTAPDDALIAIDQIAEQGEATADGPATPSRDAALDSHFVRFLQLYRAINTLPAGSKPSLPVPKHPSTGEVRLPNPAQEAGRITHPDSRRWALLFQLRYNILLHKLALAMDQKLSEDDSSAAGRAELIGSAIRQEMRKYIDVIAKRLGTMPREVGGGTGPADLRAGGPFELPAEALPVEPAARRAYLRNLLKTAGPMIDALLATTSGLAAPTTDERSMLDRMKTSDADLLAALPNP